MKQIVSWNRDKIIQKIKELHKKGRSISSEYNHDRNPKLHDASFRHFGNWGNAVKAAGFDYREILKETKDKHNKQITKWTKEKIIKKLINIKRKGEPINCIYLQRNYKSLYMGIVKKRNFSSHKKAIKAVREYLISIGNNKLAEEFDIKKIRKITRPFYYKKDIIKEIKLLYKKGVDLRQVNIQRNYMPLFNRAVEKYGSWRKTIESAYLDYNNVMCNNWRNYSKRDLIKLYEEALSNKKNFPQGIWLGKKGKQIARFLMKYLIEEKLKWKKEDIPKKISRRIFIKYKIGYPLQHFYKQSPSAVIMDICPGKFKLWEFEKVPQSYWKGKKGLENAKKVTKWLIEEKLKLKSEDISKIITGNTFRDNGLGGMFANVFNESSFLAVNSIYPGRYKEWQFINAPNNFWKGKNGKENAKRAVKWLVEKKLKIKPEQIPKRVYLKTLEENGLKGMVGKAFNGEYFLAIENAYPGMFSKEEFRHGVFPNSILHESNHNHRFRPMLERDFDNFIWGLGLRDHKHNVRYPEGYYNCDCVIRDYWIEVAGFKDLRSKSKVIKNYVDIFNKKIGIAEKHNLKLIVIERKDKEKDWYRKLEPVLNQNGGL